MKINLNDLEKYIYKSFLDPTLTKIYVIYDNIDESLYINHPYFSVDIDVDINNKFYTLVEYHIPHNFNQDLNYLIEGKYSKVSEEYKELFKKYSTFNPYIENNIRKVPRLYAAISGDDNDKKIVKKLLVDNLNVSESLINELFSIPEIEQEVKLITQII